MIHAINILVIACLLTVHAQGIADICNQRNGVMDGSRCFFSANVNVTWIDAWTYCEQQDAVLAEIHTESEWNRVTDMIRTHYVTKTIHKRAWMALRQMSSSFNDCSTATENMFWCRDINFTKKGNVSLTWMRYHACDNTNNMPNQECLGIFVTDIISRTFDRECHFLDIMPLCMIQTCNDNYTLTNSCVTEIPFETVQATTPEDCANICNQRIWCRSFNFIKDAVACRDHTCQLFSWSVLDTCPFCPSTTLASSDQDCLHYNYIP